ncbi:hypothetical protein BBJ28_00004585 [Nothophytophthora sp. Chile5]|nr:hypothetical protein BBJ28_00004585 [Nothophytophthora sp. Chile5]
MSSSSTQLTALFIGAMVLFAAGTSCLVYAVCRRLKCSPSESTLLTADDLVARQSINFHEDLLTDDELLHLWNCWHCDFANYRHKKHCALCGCAKRDSEKNGTSDAGDGTKALDALITSSQAPTVLSMSRGSAESRMVFSPNVPPSPSPSPEAPHTPFTPSASPSPSSSFSHVLTPSSASKAAVSPRLRRKEWQPVFNRLHQLVWSRQIDHDASSLASSTEALIAATSFVSRVDVSSKSQHCKLAIVPAEQTLVCSLPLDRSSRLSLSFDFDAENQSEETLSDEEAGFVAPSSIEETTAGLLEIHRLRSWSFPEKHRWFLQQTSDILNAHWGSPTMGSIDMTLVTPRDDDVLATAMRGLARVSEAHLRRPLRVAFENEPGVDAGGLVREWFGLVAAELLHERHGLFHAVHTSGGEGFPTTVDSGSGSLAYAINPKASLTVEDHLLYFRGFGRLVGKALLEGHLVPLPMTDVIFKHILGEPLSFADLIELDGHLARSLQLLWDAPSLDSDSTDGVEDGANTEVEADVYGLDFSVFHTALGTVDLKPNGRNIQVTQHNKREYVALFVQWHLALAEAKELGAIVAGVHDVLPARLLAPFDYAELRLLLCGLPVLDLQDWEAHTAVTGSMRKSKATQLTRWFWRVLHAMSERERERILQFATSSCRVPVHGFKALTTSDGRLCPFTLHWLPLTECAFPRAHTCFNRLDLPIYRCEQELDEALHLVAQMEVTGFSIQ